MHCIWYLDGGPVVYGGLSWVVVHNSALWHLVQNCEVRTCPDWYWYLKSAASQATAETMQQYLIRSGSTAYMTVIMTVEEP